MNVDCRIRGVAWEVAVWRRTYEKKYIAEIVIFCIQLFMFDISPLFAGPTDGMGMVVLILSATLILSILLGSISNNRIKYVYPAAVAAAFALCIFFTIMGRRSCKQSGTLSWPVGMLLQTIILRQYLLGNHKL